MTVNPFNHVDLRVPSMEEVLPFYEVFLPQLGFRNVRHGEGWKVFGADGEFPSVPYFAFIEQADHKPNANRIAFWVGSRQEVDRLAEVIKKAGGRSESGPRACPEYSSTYYAVFFEDPCGNKLEICFRKD
jgi:catechol 2,3-dioxygenase-like lactoylglutathione lyase family enzyme